MKVLVADDDAGVRLVARAVVEGLGHECLEATSGDEAWQMYTQHQPQVLVLDRIMPPGPDGLQLCEAIRRAEQDTHDYTYLVLLTSLTSREDMLGGIDAGADDYVAKPLDPFLLHSRLLVARRVTMLHLELARARAELAEQAATDPLTGLNNRLRLTGELDRLHYLSARYGRHYSLALCDIDHFKQYNDTYGHPAGDKALQSIATTLAGFGRRGDGVYRYGGEEFLLVLPEQPGPSAEAALERLRATVEGMAIPHSGSPYGVLTISVGVASFAPDSTTDNDSLLKQADVALYEAKTAGRNRVRLGTVIPADGG